jgi:hypothetical protein
MRTRAERQMELMRINRWLLQFSKRSPVLFWLFCAGLGILVGSLLMVLLDLVDKVKP